MRINLQVTGLLRMALGSSSLTLELPEGARVEDALNHLLQTVQGRRSATGACDSLESYLVFLRRGDSCRSIQQLQGTGTVLCDGDELILAQRFAGG